MVSDVADGSFEVPVPFVVDLTKFKDEIYQLFVLFRAGQVDVGIFGFASDDGQLVGFCGLFDVELL